MIDWDKYMNSKNFITDLGTDLKSIPNCDEKVGRYAVWAPITNSSNHQIIEVGNDLEILIEKYHISKDRVCELMQHNSKNNNNGT